MIKPEFILEAIFKELNLEYRKEFKFCESRKWRADYYLPGIKTLIECDGSVWTNGRHTRGQGFIKDCEKLNMASMLGYTVLRYSTDTIMKSQQKIIEDLKFIIMQKVVDN